MTQPRIGLIGGMSWESTAVYYKYFNEFLTDRANTWSQPALLIDSLDFGTLVPLMQQDAWLTTGQILVDSARRLVAAGATVLGIGTNTFHINYEEIQAASNVPVIDIRNAIADEMKSFGFRRLALFGTKYLFEKDFYLRKLNQLGIEVILPNDDEIQEMQRIIFEELTVGIIVADSRKFMLELSRKCLDRGADSIGLCCTEFGLLITEEESFPVIDSTKIHVRALLKAAYYSATNS